MTKYHPAILGLAAAGIAVLACLIVIELALQLMPVRSSVPVLPVTAEDPVIRYKPNAKYVYSSGPAFDAYNKGRINAQGWVSDYDYTADEPRPLVAAIGDSFVEARMIPFAQTFHQILAKKSESIRVYNFAMGGAALPQYLAFAAYARDHYRPDFLIVAIVGNDFDESLPAYKNMPRFQYFVPDETGELRPQLIGEYHPAWLKELAARSALVRYLYFHLRFAETVHGILFRLRGDGYTPEPYAGNAPAQASDRKLENSKKAVDAFLKLLPAYSGLPKERILLTIDGHRWPIYSDTVDKAEKTYFGKMRNYTLVQARRQGFEAIDLQPAFENHYASHGERFEFRQDGHWNALAHGIVAEEIAGSRAYKRFISR